MLIEKKSILSRPAPLCLRMKLLRPLCALLIESAWRASHISLLDMWADVRSLIVSGDVVVGFALVSHRSLIFWMGWNRQYGM